MAYYCEARNTGVVLDSKMPAPCVPLSPISLQNLSFFLPFALLKLNWLSFPRCFPFITSRCSKPCWLHLIAFAAGMISTWTHSLPLRASPGSSVESQLQTSLQEVPRDQHLVCRAFLPPQSSRGWHPRRVSCGVQRWTPSGKCCSCKMQLKFHLLCGTFPGSYYPEKIGNSMLELTDLSSGRL